MLSQAGRDCGCATVLLDTRDLERYSTSFGLSSEESLSALASAVASTPGLPSARITVRGGARPRLALWGEFDGRQRRRLAVQAGWLPESIREIRYVDPAEVADRCRRLAALLAADLGEAGLRRASFRAIPRGGLFVLGHLAYLLGLRPDQLFCCPPPEDGALVLVDDCALTGDRLRRSLPPEAGPDILFAHLLSPVGLREAVEDAEAGRVRCITTGDLRDRAPERLGDELEAYRRNWRVRLGSPRYWVGLPEPLAFPWSEPDRTCWDSEFGEAVPAWRVAPPELCLGNSTGAATIGVQPEGVGPLKPSEDVLFLDDGERVHVAEGDTGEVLELDGTGAAVWRSLLGHGEVGPVLEDLQSQFDADAEVLARDVRAFLEDLRSRGILARERE